MLVRGAVFLLLVVVQANAFDLRYLDQGNSETDVTTQLYPDVTSKPITIPWFVWYRILPRTSVDQYGPPDSSSLIPLIFGTNGFPTGEGLDKFVANVEGLGKRFQAGVGDKDVRRHRLNPVEPLDEETTEKLPGTEDDE